MTAEIRLSDPYTVPTRYWHRLDDGRLQCDVCPRACRLHEGQRGLCFVRGRIDEGDWFDLKFVVPGLWRHPLLPSGLGKGEHTLEVAAAKGDARFGITGYALTSMSRMISAWKISGTYPNPGDTGGFDQLHIDAVKSFSRTLNVFGGVVRFIGENRER